MSGFGCDLRLSQHAGVCVPRQRSQATCQLHEHIVVYNVRALGIDTQSLYARHEVFCSGPADVPRDLSQIREIFHALVVEFARFFEVAISSFARFPFELEDRLAQESMCLVISIIE